MIRALSAAALSLLCGVSMRSNPILSAVCFVAAGWWIGDFMAKLQEHLRVTNEQMWEDAAARREKLLQAIRSQRAEIEDDN